MYKHRYKHFQTPMYVFIFTVIFLVGILVMVLTRGKLSLENQRNFPGNNSATTPKKIAILQYLDYMSPAVDGFKQMMAYIGYTEGRDIIYYYKLAKSVDEANTLAEDFVLQDVDLIYAVTSVAGRAALSATKTARKTTIPIVFAHADNPVKTGLVQSLKSSGNNTTGVAVNMADLTAKKLEFFKQIKPNAARIGVFTATHSDPAGDLVVQELKNQAPKYGIIVVEYNIKSPPDASSSKELQAIVDSIDTFDIDGIFHTPGPVVNRPENVAILISAGKRLKIPTIFLLFQQVEIGGLFSYSHDLTLVGKQAAVMVDKVLKGAAPSQIPIEFARKNFLSINVKTAKEISITIPDDMLQQADVKIER